MFQNDGDSCSPVTCSSILNKCISIFRLFQLTVHPQVLLILSSEVGARNKSNVHSSFTDYDALFPGRFSIEHFSQYLSL